MKKYQITASLWKYKGKAAWYFITLPKEISEEIKFFCSHINIPFGSLPVEVKIGETTWKTSIFPDNKAGSYLLPVKSLIRKKEKLAEGDAVSFSLKIME
ncbi:MAG: DUF1905 domain-containing protein [Rickettsiales bacterium]